MTSKNNKVILSKVGLSVTCSRCRQSGMVLNDNPVEIAYDGRKPTTQAGQTTKINFASSLPVTQQSCECGSLNPIRILKSFLLTQFQ